MNRPGIFLLRQIEVQRKVQLEGGGKFSKTRHLGVLFVQRARGTARLRFFEVLAAGDAALFVEEIEWTIVDV